jgi:hypothetical protein
MAAEANELQFLVDELYLWESQQQGRKIAGL